MIVSIEAYNKPVWRLRNTRRGCITAIVSYKTALIINADSHRLVQVHSFPVLREAPYKLGQSSCVAQKKEFMPVQSLDIPDDGQTVWLREFGFIKAFRTTLKNEHRH